MINIYQENTSYVNDATIYPTYFVSTESDNRDGFYLERFLVDQRLALFILVLYRKRILIIDTVIPIKRKFIKVKNEPNN